MDVGYNVPPQIVGRMLVDGGSIPPPATLDLLVSRKRIKISKINRKRAIRKRLLEFVKKHGFKDAVSCTNRKLVELFASINQVEFPVNWKQWINEVFEKGECEYFKLHKGRNIRNWKSLRDLVFSCYENKCMKCGSLDRLEVDHIKPYSVYPEFATDFNNLQILCKSCNCSKNNKEIIDYRFNT